MYIYDLNNRKIVSTIGLDSIIFINPVTVSYYDFYALQEDSLFNVDMDYGVVKSYKKYENRTFKFLLLRLQSI